MSLNENLRRAKEQRNNEFYTDTRAEMHLVHSRSGERRASTRHKGCQMATRFAVQVIPIGFPIFTGNSIRTSIRSPIDNEIQLVRWRAHRDSNLGPAD